jgi:2-polyprenyl-3-methyl-5-hydroxy-6-metoxy-1,4-benzoquinol methylase
MLGIISQLKHLFLNKSVLPKPQNLVYDFNKSNPLGGKGERVDILYNPQISFDKLDIYQKSHYKRYEFAKKIISEGAVCGDFACGTGYGSVMLAEKASQVIGADINEEVVSAIQKRYSEIDKVEFICKNLLQLEYRTFFDTIISFETIEHFAEEYILQLLDIYYKALKANGNLIFSTPYRQEASEDAMKLGFHLTFHIDESKITHWLSKTGFHVESFYYQSYQVHEVQSRLENKDFIICVARKGV